MKASAVLDQVVRVLADDPLAPRYDRATTLLRHLMSAQRLVALVHPRSVSQVRAMELVAGAEQALPDEAFQFLGAVCNTSADNTMPGRVIRSVDWGAQNAVDPYWMSAPPGSEVRECIFDPDTPRVFYVSPPVSGLSPVHIRVRVAMEPAKLASEDDQLTIAGIYELPLVFIVLALVYAEQTLEGSEAKAQAYLSQAGQLLGRKLEIEELRPPAVKGSAA